MTEHSASIFVFFFLGEYSSLIIMSAFMSIFFLGGYHCPNLHNILLDPFRDIYYFLSSLNLNNTGILSNITCSKSYPTLKSDLVNYFIYTDHLFPTDNLEIVGRGLNESIFYQSLSILIDKVYGSYIFGIKIVIVVFFFIWVRASFPRLRYDQLMSLCWKELLPLVFGYIIFSICIFSSFDLIPYGTGF